MSSSVSGQIRHFRRSAIRAVAALLLAVSVLGVPNALVPVASASGDTWFDGSIQYSVVTNCVSVIQGSPYLEYGIGTYVGYLAAPDASRPGVGQTYYMHIVVSGLGNPCSDQYAWPHLVLPANTALAVTATDKVYCLYQNVAQSNCPQSLPYNGVYGGYGIAPTNGGFWRADQGETWEFQVPVKSTTTLTSSIFGAKVVVADGNANPTVTATQNVFVFNAGSPTPALVYPTPSTNAITYTTAHSSVNLYSAGLAGLAHFQLGTTTAYEIVGDELAAIPLGGTSWLVWDDWAGLAPNTLYHWRVWFQPTGSSTRYYGADQTFMTLGAAMQLGVSGIASGKAGGATQAVTVTARDSNNAVATTYRGTVKFSSTDANAALPADYTFTAADNGSHTFSLRLMTAGTQSVTARDKATSSITGTQAGISVTATVAPPTATITAQPAWRAQTGIPLAWNGANGAANYDVRYRTAAYNGAFGSPVLFASATTARTATFAGAAGSTYCFSARSRAAGGAVSGWTTETCTAVPLDERSMTRAGSWTAGTGSAYYKATFLRSSAKGAKLIRTGSQAKRIAIVATTCPTCGKVGVYWGTTLLKTVNLASAKTVNRKLITVAAFAAARTGTITLKVATTGRKVLIDGLVISRN